MVRQLQLLYFNFAAVKLLHIQSCSLATARNCLTSCGLISLFNNCCGLTLRMFYSFKLHITSAFVLCRRTERRCSSSLCYHLQFGHDVIN